MSDQKLWGGRFNEPTLPFVESFSSSLAIDQRLADADLRASMAHGRMLGRVGVIPKEEAETLVKGLEALRQEWAEGKLELRSEAEDIHSEIERWLYEKVGPVAGKLHTARSRNDQVVTATRLYTRERVGEIAAAIKAFQSRLIEIAENNLHTVMPGVTHLQHGQPVSLAHHLMAYFWMLERDRERIADASHRVNQLPLGCAALAGTSFPLDREGVAKELGFEGICENSLDAVSDRDFVLEILNACSLVMLHLSRLSEEMILWSTPEFGYVELADGVTTGSSLMPQKKNPDVAELIRGRSGRIAGTWVGAFTMLKGLPLSYNRDLQEDKTFLFEGMDTALSCVTAALVLLNGVSFQPSRLSTVLEGDFSNATDLADHLVRQGMPFREAHSIVGKVVRYCLESAKALDSCSVEDFSKFSPLFASLPAGALKPRAVMEARVSRGGTAPSAVREQIAKAKSVIGCAEDTPPLAARGGKAPLPGDSKGARRAPLPL